MICCCDFFLSIRVVSVKITLAGMCLGVIQGRSNLSNESNKEKKVTKKDPKNIKYIEAFVAHLTS